MTANNDQFSPDMVADDEPLTPFDVRDSSGRQGLLKLAIGMMILLAIAFAILKIYHPEGSRDRNEAPRITAENTPFKVVPDDREGLQVPDQDRKVFDVMDGSAPDTDVSNITSPEEPVTIPQRDPNAANIQVDPPVTPSRDTFRSEPVPDVSRPNPVPAVTQPTRPAIATGGSEYVVQVASVRSQADANAVWAKLESQFSDVLGTGLYADIKRVDLAEKGIYYRTRVAGLADKSSANILCQTFKASNQACYVTKR
ncbi:SPOR domain-containing protein [Litorimonas taeanensis]|uniref:SPOR domain-containing protein n=1 Tax=Litorimonas taeanensis TaxID=568099 RepID=UPI000EAC7FF0|nr:SPOR domain-containing protein [Litorimonas taeanensis]